MLAAPARALAAIATTANFRRLIIGAAAIPLDSALNTLEEFEGVKRRFEVRYQGTLNAHGEVRDVVLGRGFERNQEPKLNICRTLRD